MSYTSALLDMRSNNNPYLQLICSCPQGCKCNNIPLLKKWQHKYCSDQSYITNQGDIICEGLLCNSYFIKNASFQCSVEKKSNTWHCYKSSNQLYFALAQAMQAAEMNLSDYDSLDFITTLNTQVKMRWMTE